MLRSKKGFTLIELTVVLAVIAIIVTMVCGFMLTYNRAALGLQDHTTAITDIAAVQASVKEWVRSYDNAETTLAVAPDAGNQRLTATVNRTTHTWEFKNGKITIDGTATNQEFDCVTKCTFSIQNSLISCRVKFDDSEQELLFPLFSNGQRSRYSSEERQ